MKATPTNYVYILQCSDNTLYTGWTNNLKRRLDAHNSGQGAKYTRGRLPVRLLYSKAFTTQQEAMQREYEIKQLSRKQKLDFIKSANPTFTYHEL